MLQKLPGIGQGYARSGYESERPEQWRGLIAGWAMFLGHQGDRLFDVSGFQYHSTTFNLLSWVTTTQGVMGLDFAGVNSYAGMPILMPRAATTGLTVYAQVFPRSVTGFQGLVCRWESPAEWMLALWDNTIMMDVSNAGDIDARSATATVATNTWYHFAGTYQASTYVRVFINGVQMAEETVNVPAVLASSAGPETRIGTRDPTVTWPLNGIITQARIYDRAMSAKELAEIVDDPYAWLRPRQRSRAMAGAAGVGLMAQERSLMRRVHGRMHGRVN